MTGAYRGVPRARRPFAVQAPDVLAADITRLVERRAREAESAAPTAEDETVARLLARRAAGPLMDPELSEVDDPVSRLLRRRQAAVESTPDDSAPEDDSVARLLARRTASESPTEPVDDPVSRLLARRFAETD